MHVINTTLQHRQDESSESQSKLDQYLSDIAKGDQSAFESLFKAVSGRLFGILLRILKNRELAEDALQETFIKVWKHANTYSAKQGAPMTWLNSLARNHALDVLRRSGTRAGVNVKIPELNPDTWRTPTRAFSDTFADIEGLQFCLQKLSTESQTCIVGLYCDGHTQEELSQLLQRPLGTVKSWIRRGLDSLRECLNDEH